VSGALPIKGLGTHNLQSEATLETLKINTRARTTKLQEKQHLDGTRAQQSD
jgi:hypothetical protein